MLSGSEAGGPAWMQQMLGWQLAAPLPAMMQPMPSIPPSMPPSMPPPLPQIPLNPHACAQSRKQKLLLFICIYSKLFGTTGEPPVILVSSIVKTSFGNETPGLTRPTLSKHPHALRSARLIHRSACAPKVENKSFSFSSVFSKLFGTTGEPSLCSWLAL